ncbi:hypothetical protein [Haliangium sp.]|uniref:hypothetical protein n=1 Tax=Haliangium sp. TaxID=2663208 RepID=UPI003D1349DC
MNTRRLLHWGDLDERRRRRARGGFGALPPWLLGLGVGLLFAAELARRVGLLGPTAAGDASPAGASKLYLAGVAAAHTLVVFGAPFRMFWRHDAAMIARLSISGRAVFTVALIRSVRASARVLLASMPGALALALAPAAAFAADPALAPAGFDIALRHFALAGAAALISGLLAPAVALLAGGLVASEQVQATLDSLGGEFHAPKTSWLGVLPGLTGTALALLFMAAAAWARGGAVSTAAGDPWVLLALAAGGSVAALLMALGRAEAVMPGALREVVALDRERLAHVDLVEPTAIDRAVMGRLGGAHSGAAAVFGKDARLTRRRYPIPYFVGFAGLATMLLLAGFRPEDLVMWSATVAAGLGVYGAVMARRLLTPPTEHLRFLRSLPVGHAGAARAKRARVLLWVGCYLAPGAIAVVVRAPEPASAAVAMGVITAAAAVLGMAALRAPRSP